MSRTSIFWTDESPQVTLYMYCVVQSLALSKDSESAYCSSYLLEFRRHAQPAVRDGQSGSPISHL